MKHTFRKEKLAVKQIETYYLCYRDKKMFKMLKTAVRAAVSFLC